METRIYPTSEELGQGAAEFSAGVLNRCIAEQGSARLLLSTGASQFDTFKALVKTDVDWSKVEAFHLDEYINLPDNHPASFKRYLLEKFVNLVPLREMHFVQADGDLEANIKQLSDEIRRSPIDLSLIGIGENSHIAFNDPPADFDVRDAYIVVSLDEDCKKQQVREGWFASVDEVPKQAITMSVHQIMQSKVIVSCVPYEVKAKAIKLMMENDVTNRIPASMLKTHPDFTLFLDRDSASLIEHSSTGV